MGLIGKAGSLIRRTGEAASGVRPFYSAVDDALSSLPNKALGEQFIKDLLKKGAKPQEIIDRKLDKILGAPIVQKTRTVNLKKPDAKGRTQIEEKYFEVTPSQKGEKAISRADVEKAAADNPAPQIEETTLGSSGKLLTQGDIDRLERQARRSGNWDAYEDAVQRYEAQQLGRGGEGINERTKFAQYSTPGGENYREILIRLPTADRERRVALEQQIYNQKEKIKQSFRYADANPEFAEKMDQIRRAAETKLTALEDELAAIGGETKEFKAGHWEQPNVLAHARVSDRTGPNGEKILHVEEIQSDWHQKGRKEGYAAPKENVNEKLYDEYIKDLTNRYQERIANTYAPNETDPLRRAIEIPASLRNERDPQKIAETMGELDKLQDMFALMYQERNAASKGVPDAPFKSTWHELVMKRLLDDAARNGYDNVIITPGKKQIDRYENAFRKNIDSLEYEPYVNDQGKQMFEVSGIKNGQSVFDEEDVTPERLRELLGKEMHEKIMSGYGESLAAERPHRPDWKRISNENLSIGGEGMKGFYDQMLPAYLNKYGKEWGAKVEPHSYILPDSDVPLHSFRITPEMRESFTQKGQPLYQAAPIAIGAGAMQGEPQEESQQELGNFTPFRKGGAVNLDAMRLAVMDKAIKKAPGGGIFRQAAKAIGKAAESAGGVAPVVANKNLTTLQDFHTSLGDRIKQAASDRQSLIESMPFKYDANQYVFTADSAAKNKPPYKILHRTLVGNQPKREPGTLKTIKDPVTGKAERTPYEQGYMVRHEMGDDWAEFSIPESAIKGVIDSDMRRGGYVANTQVRKRHA